MGNAARRKRKFFSEHPFCCFCGGATPATTEDHFPSRALFRDRKWPEGYVFPACLPCNQATARDELIVAWISRLGVEGFRSDAEADATLREFRELMESIAQNFPGLFQEMRARTTDEQRRRALGLGIAMPPGSTLADVPVINSEDPRIQDAVLNFSRKLALALYYKTFAEAMPVGGGIAVRWYTNYQMQNEEIPQELAEIMPNFPKLTRANQPLQDQFFYRIGAAKEDDGRRMAVFLALFQASFAVLGFMSNRKSMLQRLEQFEGMGRGVFAPYDWPPKEVAP